MLRYYLHTYKLEILWDLNILAITINIYINIAFPITIDRFLFRHTFKVIVATVAVATAAVATVAVATVAVAEVTVTEVTVTEVTVTEVAVAEIIVFFAFITIDIY